MRLPLLGLASLLLIVGSALPAVAQDPDATKTVTVASSEFSSAEVIIKKGDFVRWEWEAGSHFIVLSDQPALSEDGVTLHQFKLDAENKDSDYKFNDTGTYHFFVQDRHDTMAGTVTVLEATPVRRATWGHFKSLFENP
jgi:plastocyanin